MTDRVNKKQVAPAPVRSFPLGLSLLALLGSAVLVGVSQFPITDIFWHLKIGEWMIEHQRLFTHDIFSFTFSNKPVAIHSPFFQILVAYVYQKGGWLALHGLHIVLLFTLAGLVYAFFREKGANQLTGIAAAFFVITIVRPQSDLHPQLFFNVFVLLYLYVWYAYRPNHPTTPLLYFGIFFAITLSLWGLLHPSFPFGYILILVFAVEYFVFHNKSYLECSGLLSAIALSMLALYLIHPNILTNVLTHAQADAMLASVTYWKPLFSVLFSDPIGIWIGVLILFVLLRSSHYIWTCLRHKQWDILPRLGLSLTPYLYGISAHTLFPSPLFGSISPLLYRSPKRFYAQKEHGLFPDACACISSLLVLQAKQYRPGLGLNETRVPVKAVNFLQKEAAGQRIFHAYNFGGYMLFAMGPLTQVFIDPRSSQLYLTSSCSSIWPVFVIIKSSHTWPASIVFVIPFCREPSKNSLRNWIRIRNGSASIKTKLRSSTAEKVQYSQHRFFGR